MTELNLSWPSIRTALVGLALLSPVTLPSTSFGQTATLQDAVDAFDEDEPVIAFDKLDSAVGARKKQTAWSRPIKLRDSNDHLPWINPTHRNLAKIHRNEPSFLNPPANAKSLASLDQPTVDGQVQKASDIRPLNSFSAPLNQPTNEYQPTPPPPAVRAGRRRAGSRTQSVQVAQNNRSDAAFDDLDLEDLLPPDDGASLQDEPPLLEDSLDPLPELDSSDDLSSDDMNLDGDLPNMLDESLDESLNEPLQEPLDGLDTEEDSFSELPLDDRSSESPPSADELFPDDDEDEEEDDERNSLAEFNGRDCPNELEGFRSAWEELRSKPLSEISLDITPSFEPTESDPAEAAKHRDEKLAKSPARVWRDRQGNVIAEGRLTDYRHGRVYILGNDGQTKMPKSHTLSNADQCFVSAWWGTPTEFTPESERLEVRNWAMMTMTWKASGICHKPLYFEDVQLERYGHSAGPVKQTFLSGAHFFGNVFFLPYHMGLNPPNECQYTLGYYRPGNCAPWLLEAIPLSARAARMQAGAIASGIAWIP
ncbi:MAG: hypothetical protein R3C28_23755 [Pirellulaceae bacterium]